MVHVAHGIKKLWPMWLVVPKHYGPCGSWYQNIMVHVAHGIKNIMVHVAHGIKTLWSMWLMVPKHYGPCGSWYQNILTMWEVVPIARVFPKGNCVKEKDFCKK